MNVDDIRSFVKNIFCKKKNAFYKYSVVSACYNVEPYLNDFFKSIVNQSISFEDNIYLIMVDDGSTDLTYQVIQKWVSKYPRNITCVRKENGGQATARNEGLRFVKTPWVTFIDPDDFINDVFFENIDNFLKKSTNIDKFLLIATNIICYHENSKLYKDNHPLSYKFKKEETTLPISKLGLNIQLSAASAVFNLKYIKQHKIEFCDIKPCFEDGYFIGNLLISESDKYLVFLKNSKYFYRKRADGTSTLDGAWTDKRRFGDVFIKGYLPLLDRCRNIKNASTVIQNEVLYDIAWHINYTLDNPGKLSFLSDDEKETYLACLDKCFNCISTDTIFAFSGAGIWHYHKLGMINCFKKIDPHVSPLVYVEKFDKKKKQIRVRLFGVKSSFVEFFLDSSEIIPLHKKVIDHFFLTRYFISEFLYWLPINNNIGTSLKIKVDDQIARISCKSVVNKDFPLKNLCSLFDNEKDYPNNAPWMFMDRFFQADDNAEHLYRWVMKNHPEREIYFLLPKNSVDYPRLKNEGFNLVEFGSKQHREISDKASKIISSHIDARHVTNYWGDNSLDDKQLIFLQHGVTKDDISRWMNSKKRIDLLVTATKPEYMSMVSDTSLYRYTDKEIKLLGFPRHDALLDAVNKKCNKILIMPTWRSYLVTNILDKQVFVDNIFETMYVKSWTNLLNSPILKELAHKYNYTITYAPHINMQSLIKGMDIPSYIEILRHTNDSIQNLFKNCALMISDYSSVAFEFAYLEKPVLYYQFDEDEFFKSHLYGHGYFDYRRDGFGYVCVDQSQLLSKLEELLSDSCKNPPVFMDRIHKTFGLKDGKNCERNYNAIIDLDAYHNNEYSERLIFEAIKEAITKDKYDIALRRANILKSFDSNNKSYEAILTFVKCLNNFATSNLRSVSIALNSLNLLPEFFIELKNSFLVDFYLATHSYTNVYNILNIESQLSVVHLSKYVWVCKHLNVLDVDFDRFSITDNLKSIYNSFLRSDFDFVCNHFIDISSISYDVQYSSNKLISDLYNNVVNDEYLSFIVSLCAFKSGNILVLRNLLNHFEFNNINSRAVDITKVYYLSSVQPLNADDNICQIFDKLYKNDLKYMTIDELDIYLSSFLRISSYKTAQKISYAINDIYENSKDPIYDLLSNYLAVISSLKKSLSLISYFDDFDFRVWMDALNKCSFYHLRAVMYSYVFLNLVIHCKFIEACDFYINNRSEFIANDNLGGFVFSSKQINYQIFDKFDTPFYNHYLDCEYQKTIDFFNSLSKDSNFVNCCLNHGNNQLYTYLILMDCAKNIDSKDLFASYESEFIKLCKTRFITKTFEFFNY